MKKFFEKNDLVKIAGLSLIFVTILTWLIPSSYYSGSELVNNGLARTGIETFFSAGYYGFTYYLMQILYLLVLGGFYGILSVTSGYKKLVANIAKSLKGNKVKDKVIIVLISLFFAAFTSISNDILPVLVFVPFIISVLLKANYDKFTAFSATFGSMFVGLLGATYSHYNFDYIYSYLGLDLITGIWTRVLIFAVAFILLMLITVMHMNKKKKKSEEIVDMYEVEELDKKEKKVKVWPLAIILGFVLIFSIVGYINWEVNFKITIFTEFFNWLRDFTLGDYNIFAYILGINAYSYPLGQLQIISMAIVLILSAGVISLIYGIGFDNCLEAFAAGFKKMMKPTLFYLIATMMFVLSYNSYIASTITDAFLGLTKSFNPFILAILGVILAALNVDHGFTAYLIGSKLAATYAGSTTAIMIVLNTTYGLAQFIAPTGILLFFGLSYLNISYKSYMKYIWKFLLGIIAILLIVFAAISY